jgi:hypothetical protein
MYRQYNNRSAAILLGLFVPWEDIQSRIDVGDGQFLTFSDLWKEFESQLSARLRFHASNFELLQKSKDEAIEDQQQLAAMRGEQWEGEQGSTDNTQDAGVDGEDENTLGQYYDEEAEPFNGHQGELRAAMGALQAGATGLVMFGPAEMDTTDDWYASFDALGDGHGFGRPATKELLDIWRKQHTRYKSNGAKGQDVPGIRDSVQEVEASVRDCGYPLWSSAAQAVRAEYSLNHKQFCAVLTVALELDKEHVSRSQL